MNPTQTSQNPNVTSNENLLEKAFENNEFTQPILPPIAEEDLVTHSDEHKKSFRSDWVEFMSLTSESPVSKSEMQQTIESESFTTETTEGPVSKTEVQEMVIEKIFNPKEVQKSHPTAQANHFDIINKQKGSTSAWKEAGIKILPDYKDVGKTLFGGLGILWEIFRDTTKLLVEKFTEKILTPEEAKKDAEKKAKQKEKNARIQDFYNKMAAQKAALVSVEANRFQEQEKENINKKVKLNTSYKGIKDSAGRLTAYAASMFEREQLDEEKTMKKIEKQQKMAAVSKGPDLNLDKVAEGGFLSSTGGQGAG